MRCRCAVTNPNNPVGTILTEAEMDAIVAAAAAVGAWILADEVRWEHSQCQKNARELRGLLPFEALCRSLAWYHASHLREHVVVLLLIGHWQHR